MSVNGNISSKTALSHCVCVWGGGGIKLPAHNYSSHIGLTFGM